MCDGFNHSALQLAVAQICQSMGWDALQKSSHDLLTDVLRHYLEEIAKAAHGYCQQYCRTEPNLNDLSLAFQDTGVLLHELEDFVSQVDQVPFIHQLPRYPKPKASVLHHPRNGEIVDRLEHYYDYLPPLVTKLLQNEDEEKAATVEDADATDGGQEREGTDGLIRKEIKTVGEETHNEPVALKRHQESPPGFENETKKRRVEPPFMQKGNRGNEMDILHALQGNLSSPSPTPSPDAWSTEKTFDIPPPTLPTSVVRSTGKAKSTLASKAVASFAGEETKPTASNKQSGKSPAVKPKASPKKKAKPSKAASSPAKKLPASSSPSPPKVTKGSSPSLMKSPLTTTISSTQEKKTNVTKDSPKKSMPKKEKKPAAKAKKPQMKSPPVAKPSSGAAKENIAAKEGMPKLIIKPIKQEEHREPQFAVSELLPADQRTSIKEKSLQPKNTKGKQSTSEKPKAKKKAKTKQAMQDAVTFKMETKETSASSANVGLKFSIADFVAPPLNTSVGDSNVLGSDTGDLLSEHKKKKKKRKEKDRDKEKKKDKNKKMKVDHPASSPAPSFSSTPIPRIKVKLEPPLCTPLANETSTKLDASSKGRANAGTSRSPALEKPQPTYSATASTSLQESEKAPMTKMAIKKEPPERTVISQTLSTTFVHGYSKEYYCPVCGDPDDGTFMIGCDGCDEWFHGRCVGIEDDPGNVDWFCSSCLAKKDKDNKDKLNKKKKKKKSKGKEK